jgi:hypothetical protein
MEGWPMSAGQSANSGYFNRLRFFPKSLGQVKVLPIQLLRTNIVDCLQSDFGIIHALILSYA